MGVILPLRPQKLIYPGGLAGFNPAHPAAQNARLSAISRGAVLVDSLTGRIGTNTNTPTGSIDGRVGLGTSYSGFNNFTTFSGVSDTSQTVAFIGTYVASGGFTNGAIFSSSADPGGLGIGADSGNNWYVHGNSSVYGTTFVPVANVPYFAAASASGTNPASLLVMRLDTGQVQIGTNLNSGGNITSGNGSYLLGTFVGAPTNNAVWHGLFACGMVSGVYLSPAQLLQWAQDPWSYWYPQTLDLSMMLAAAQVTDVLMPQIWM